MIINKNELLKALEIVKPGLANKELIEQSTSFAFIRGRVITYNDEISISHPVKGLNLEGAILADNLYKFLGKIKKDEVEFNVEGNEIVLTTGRAKAGLTLQAEIKLPLDEDVAEKGNWVTLPENFLKYVSFVMTSCSRDMSRPLLTCVHVNESGVIEASDGFRIAYCDLKQEMPVPTFLLPATSAVDMVKLKPTQIATGKGWVHFQTEEETIISCRVFEDTFVNTAQHLNIKGTKLLLPRTTEEILTRAMVFAKRDHLLDENISVILSSKRFKMRAASDSGWFEEEANMQYEGTEIKFDITPYLLKGILAETLECTLDSKKDRLLFEGEGWKYMTLLRG